MTTIKSLGMKKIVAVVQILVLIIFVLKIAALGEMVQKTSAPSQMPTIAKQTMGKVLVQESEQANKKADEDHLSKERDLFRSLEAQRGELNKKEESLKSEEQRLLTLKKEILEKIDLLHVQEEKLNAALEASKTVDNQRYKDFAKVLEAAPPAKAGQMLEQLDVKTAAGITMNMKKDKAGAIWGYLSPQKAVEITREVTRAGK